MNNLQFSGVLDRWNERVAMPRRGKRGKILQKQYEEIRKLKEVRDALVHGMCTGRPTILARSGRFESGSVR
jgi:hypothetical protein